MIYPFGLNQSQKLAVERALSSKISIIQGPPGTGKTQTILNIIANVVRVGKTVAVVSNNNSATHNVAEKLEKKDAGFLTAFLGSLANKEKFLESQTGIYPNMHDWEMQPETRQRLEQEISELSKELNEMLTAKNRIAEIQQEILQLNPEQHYFGEYYATCSHMPEKGLTGLSLQKILALWTEFEQHTEQSSRLSLLKKFSILFRFNYDALKLFQESPETVIPFLQSRFYSLKRRELEDEKQKLNAPLTEEERGYARNPLTHIDFLLFGQMDKQPLLAIEVDGTAFHRAGSKQEARDEKKDSILEKCGLSLLRLRTDGSGEEEKIRSALQAVLNG